MRRNRNEAANGMNINVPLLSTCVFGHTEFKLQSELLVEMKKAWHNECVSIYK